MVKIGTAEFTQALRQNIESFDAGIEVFEIGEVDEIGDGIALVKGLPNVRSQELIAFESGVLGVAFNLQEDEIGVIILGDYTDLREGEEVRSTGRIASVPVGDVLIGRVVDAIGRPIDGKGPIESNAYRAVERPAPGIIERKDVDRPLQTGLLAIDAMMPIGRGQRELIIGDRQTGKTTIALDTIINQKGKGVICIYVAIGQKRAQVAQVAAQLAEYGAMGHTIIVAATASDPVALQYIAPYAGCAIAEAFMEEGRDALVVYDDLSKHAWAYRQVSLLLRRPPGREAYPGDLFYLHSRLLERAAQLSDARGGGSMTALPIVETLLGDVSAYVPTNIISITDGQIYLETDLFNEGQRPAINVGLSVSRVGGDAQHKAMRQVVGKLRIDLANYRAIRAFAQFGATELDRATREQLEQGRRLTELLKQQQFNPMPLGHMVAVLFAGTRGYLDSVSAQDIRSWKQNFLEYLDARYATFEEELLEQGSLTVEIETRLRTAIEQFQRTWSG
jgi:F-type H+-transporting ATPase subunit alpha